MSNTTSGEEKKTHDGRNLKRIREILKVKQSTLAHDLGSDWNQKKISQLEDKETIDDTLMAEIANALKVPVDVIKNFDDEKAVMNIQNNYDGSTNHNASFGTQYNINTLEKWIEAMEENKKLVEKNENLYERLLQVEKEKNELLQRLLDETK